MWWAEADQSIARAKARSIQKQNRATLQSLGSLLKVQFARIIHSAAAVLLDVLEVADFEDVEALDAAGVAAGSLVLESELVESELLVSEPPASALLLSAVFESPPSPATGLLAGLVALLSFTYHPDPLKITPAA
jgi:hypothetical protein